MRISHCNSRSLAVKWERHLPVATMGGQVMVILALVGKRSFGIN